MAAAKGKTERIRAFVALDLDTTSLRRVVRTADRLRMASGAPAATWSAGDKMHITLKFAGELDAAAAAPIGKALRELAEGKPAPAPCTVKLDAFPKVEHARVIVAELVDASGDITKLAAAVDKLAAKHGVPKEDRPFRPHVTLARLKRPYDARKWLRADVAEAAGECRCVTLTLYRSELKPEGSVYIPLATFAFATG
ncbi:MAG TPA: RNA 2',3'-cyclic phosphodiesterase [Polyangiaceae bacterium]|nr:RNA 2',3'-cyclic phosphodiesterase [Polyangiaceae bacterium]